ncbi:DNA polymerase/3'-5' exonuclease PolX [candidate division KSB1 bacterium]|nr:DNA polymerase/3'-5' exonuclease PolX [candidate division KSB1 bacterium]RQW05581.1 MAG: DNA polymerase/3'-5' exonuclease PolX [candidate division KSB1 bacterium]
MQNNAVVDILEKFSDVLEFKGEVGFKINAYRKAARNIADLSEDILKVWREGRLGDIPGVGKALQDKIGQFLETGHIRQLDEHLRTVPKDLFKLLEIHNFGPKTAALAFNELGIETLEQLGDAIADGRLATLPGMGPKKVENIKKSLEHHALAAKQISIGAATKIVAELIEFLQEKAHDKIGRISPAGSVRRYKETVHDIDIIVETEHGSDVIEIFTTFPHVTRILGAGPTKGSVLLDDRYQVDLRAIPSESYGAAQQYFTGSKAHNVKLREMARKQGYKINEWGIYRDDMRVGGENEEDIYETLGLDWMPPELREDRGEIEAALEKKLPTLVTLDDIQADLHMHTTSSDGHHSLTELVEFVRKRGYSYMAVCNHSKSAMYANGLSEDRLLAEIEAIHQLNSGLQDFVVLAGSEVDILPDGSLDFKENILRQLDFVVASIHSAFKTDPTARTLAAMENKYVDVIGHPTGRLISRREGFELDMDKVIETAARTGTALEVNSFWDRLDLNDINVRTAVSRGVKISINTDTHHEKHLSLMALGVGTARRGWAQKQDVINSFSLRELTSWQKRNR